MVPTATLYTVRQKIAATVANPLVHDGLKLIPSVTRTFSTTHQYVDDNPTVTTVAVYTVKVKLRKGTNRILVKITNGNGAHGLYFTLVTEHEVKQAGKK